MTPMLDPLPEQETVTLWSCSLCGPSFTSRRNWCDLGCGRDYNRMTAFVPLARLEAAEARARSAEEALGELRGAANEYLARQNFGGYKDGNYGHDEGCREARADLCGVLYALNAALHSSQPEEQR